MRYLPQRKKLRLEWYDYSQAGYYFVTICTRDREKYFWKIVDGEMVLNEYGGIAENVLTDLHKHYKNCEIDEYIFMPNHFHGIIIIHNSDVGNGLKPFHSDKQTEKQHNLSEIIRWFKTFSSRKINDSQQDFYFTWQKSFHDVIIRNQDQLDKSREYIRMNPMKWEEDENNIC